MERFVGPQWARLEPRGEVAMSPDLVDEATPALWARVGQVLRQKWRIDALLGVGGMAAVYRGTHRNGRRVALKVLHPEFCANEALRGRFLLEAYVANRIASDGAVAILDDDVSEDGAAFLVMELLEGETLEQRCRRARIDSIEMLAIAEQVLDVLTAAHDQGIVHRDLKPSNLFLTEGRVKVLDFGIAHLCEAATGPSTTMMGEPIGTPAFMPCEQARGRWELVDGRTDLWALGATMFTCLSGRYVHEAATVNEQLLSAMTRPAAPIASVAPTVPAALANIVDRALCFDRDRRWQDARAMREAVRCARQELLASPLTAPLDPAVGRARARRLATRIGVAAAVVLGVAGAFAAAAAFDRRDVSHAAAAERAAATAEAAASAADVAPLTDATETVTSAPTPPAATDVETTPTRAPRSHPANRDPLDRRK